MQMEATLASSARLRIRSLWILLAEFGGQDAHPSGRIRANGEIRANVLDNFSSILFINY